LASSTIIEEVDNMRELGLASLAYFYCDYREQEKTGLRGLLSSLLVQLSHQSDGYSDTLSKLYSKHNKGLDRPRDGALVDCLKDVLQLPRQAPIYIIVDALDECPNKPAVGSPRAEVLTLLEDLIESQFPNLHICVTSRPEHDIEDVLGPLILCDVSLHDQTEQKTDIEKYIESVINTHQDFGRWKPEDKKLAIDVLTRKADAT
jgi:NACHT domain